MIRLSIAYFYDLGATLKPLAMIKGDTALSDVWANLYSAQVSIEGLFSAEWFLPAIKSAYAPGQKLLASIKAITSRNDIGEGRVTHFEAYNVTSGLTEFEMVLRAELSIADAYFVSRKAGFDTGILVSNAEVNFPRELGLKVPAAVSDIREAGRALAFELSTAAGFHVFRAVEVVLRRYWEIVTEGRDHPAQQSIGVYLKGLEELTVGSKKVISVLRQIKDLHRNPLVHPERPLTFDEAVGLFGIAQSAISAMIAEIPAQATPALPVGALSALSADGGMKKA